MQFKHKPVALICAIFALSTLTACGGHESIKGEGDAQEETRQVTSFNGLMVDGQYQILAEIGSPQKISIISNKNLLPYIQTSVDNKTLHVESKAKVQLYPTVQQQINLTSPNIEALTLAGESTFKLSNLNTKQFKVVLAGANQLQLAGKAEDVKITVEGTSSVDAKALTAKHVDVVINGTGTILVNPKETLNVVINGSGTVVNYGKDAKVQQIVNGAGKIESK